MPRRLLIGPAAFLLVVACASDRLSETLVESTVDRITMLTVAADVRLADDDVECVARRLTDEQAGALDEEPLSPASASVLAAAVVECVGIDDLAVSALTPVAEGASEASLACAADRLGDEVTTLLAGTLAGTGVGQAEIELDVATALAMCLEPQELLNPGSG